MADKLLSQAELDAMVGSLTRNKTETPPAAKTTHVVNTRIETTQRVVPSANTPPPATVKTTSGATAATQRPAPPVRQEPKQEPKVDVSTNALTAKIGELTKQLGQMTATLQRMDARMSQLEARVLNSQDTQVTARQVQQLGEEFKKVLVNLQGTPGYGIHHSFHCDKCDDHGTVATVFRCTKCGKETLRGWWPAKQK